MPHQVLHVARSVSSTPPPHSDHLDKVAIAFVYKLVKQVVPKFLSLATVQEQPIYIEAIVNGLTPIAPEPHILTLHNAIVVYIIDYTCLYW